MNVFLLLFIAALVVCVIIYISNNAKLRKQCEEMKSRNEKLSSDNDRMKDRVDRLSVYESVLNADEEAKRILSDADRKAVEIINEAKNQADIELVNAEMVKNEQIELKKRAKEDADLMKENASREASYIIETAREKAKEIAGEAYDIAERAKYYEGIAKAMRNVIEGYGDEYLKLSTSLLDDIADEFGFDEAGQRLKASRERTRLLFKNNQAATCDYAEKNRRETAINFVADAFNGKVDTILALVKKDNYGKLEQKIKDAFSLVNHLGEAFRNARILPDYLDARLEELKWACIVMELKFREKEEQRRIKEQIREEEKARREYERAMKEAEKEKDMIRKAMDKAKMEIAKASEEQKAKYEAKLAELEMKLKEAEEKNQRALSMAQQTKSGHVYVISNVGSFGDNVFKIGMTRRLEPLDRVRELGDASVPFPFDVHAMIYSEDAPSLETALHKCFVQNQVNKVNPRKEFFRIPLSEIKKEIDGRNMEVKWTLTSEAYEYRQTLAIEKAMANDPSSASEWAAHQQDYSLDMDDEEEE